jgi:hypothetical protein
MHLINASGGYEGGHFELTVSNGLPFRKIIKSICPSGSYGIALHTTIIYNFTFMELILGPTKYFLFLGIMAYMSM